MFQYLKIKKSNKKKRYKNPCLIKIKNRDEEQKKTYNIRRQTETNNSKKDELFKIQEIRIVKKRLLDFNIRKFRETNRSAFIY
jgi:hypothetical protein